MQQSVTSKIGSSKGWTLALGIGAAVLAAILLIAYLVQYRSSVNDSTSPTPVLVAKNLIPKGTSGTVIAKKQLFQAATLSKDDLKVGAISDPAYLNGRVAVGDIFPGQQITTADLSVGLTDAIPTQLSGVQRAVAIPIAGGRGLVGYVASGDRVDIYFETGSTGGTSSGLLSPNVLVMRRPPPGATGRPPARCVGARRSWRSQRTAGRFGSCCVRPVTRRTPRSGDHDADLLKQINSQR